MNRNTPRLVVLISGGGTTLQNFIDRIADGRMNVVIAGVISNRKNVQGVERAIAANLPVEIIPSGEDFSNRVFAAIDRLNPDLVCLAGWLKLLTIPDRWAGKVLNIHPSLLPAFGGHGMYGAKVHEEVLASGASESGCTVHLVDNSYDTGPIVAQSRVPVLQGDTPETLAKRVFEAECELYPKVILHETRTK